MAKTQTFGDKVKKSKEAQKPVVKVIKGLKNEDGSTRFIEKFVKIDDLNNVTQLDIN